MPPVEYVGSRLPANATCESWEIWGGSFDAPADFLSNGHYVPLDELPLHTKQVYTEKPVHQTGVFGYHARCIISNKPF